MKSEDQRERLQQLRSRISHLKQANKNDVIREHDMKFKVADCDDPSITPMNNNTSNNDNNNGKEKDYTAEEWEEYRERLQQKQIHKQKLALDGDDELYLHMKQVQKLTAGPLISQTSTASIADAVDDSSLLVKNQIDPLQFNLVRDSAEQIARMQNVVLGIGDKKRKRPSTTNEVKGINSQQPQLPVAHNVHINERNKRFIKNASRAYDDSTREIRDNIERGTAL